MATKKGYKNFEWKTSDRSTVTSECKFLYTTIKYGARSKLTCLESQYTNILTIATVVVTWSVILLYVHAPLFMDGYVVGMSKVKANVSSD